MSPENQGVFQFLKEVTFQRILAFLQVTKMGLFWEYLFAVWCTSRFGLGDYP
jgi:hypothetical protein